GRDTGPARRSENGLSEVSPRRLPKSRRAKYRGAVHGSVTPRDDVAALASGLSIGAVDLAFSAPVSFHVPNSGAKHRASRGYHMNRIVVAALLAASALVSVAKAQDVPTIRVGWTIPAEEAKYWMQRRPEKFPNLGKTYKIEWSQ